MSETITEMLNDCSNVNCHKYKIERILTEEQNVIKKLPEENKEEQIKSIIKYAKGKVSVWKFNEVRITKSKLLNRSRKKKDRLFRKLAQDILKVDDTIEEIDDCKNYSELLLLRDKIRGEK